MNPEQSYPRGPTPPQMYGLPACALANANAAPNRPPTEPPMFIQSPAASIEYSFLISFARSAKSCRGIFTIIFAQSVDAFGIDPKSTNPSTILRNTPAGSSRKSPIPSAKSSTFDDSHAHARPAGPMMPPRSNRWT